MCCDEVLKLMQHNYIALPTFFELPDCQGQHFTLKSGEYKLHQKFKPQSCVLPPNTSATFKQKGGAHITFNPVVWGFFVEELSASFDEWTGSGNEQSRMSFAEADLVEIVIADHYKNFMVNTCLHKQHTVVPPPTQKVCLQFLTKFCTEQGAASCYGTIGADSMKGETSRGVTVIATTAAVLSVFLLFGLACRYVWVRRQR